MLTVASVPAAALVGGAALGIWLVPDPAVCFGPLGTAIVVAACLHRRHAAGPWLAAVAMACGAAGLGLGADAARCALDTSLRRVLDEEVGGFSLSIAGPGGRHEPVPVRAVLLDDAAIRDDYVSLRAEVRAVHVRGGWQGVSGGVALSVSGEPLPSRAEAWRAGRTIEAPVTFRRPARYLNDGVPDHERLLALDGTTLLGSIKSGLLVEVLEPGSAVQEVAGAARDWVRRGAARWIAPHGSLPAAIVVAILIGDRTGLPADVRERLQAAGTYHVIAISGGNIAILAGVLVVVLRIGGVQGRAAAVVIVMALLLYAQIAAAEPSVWRATAMGVLYFGARVLDHRTSPWHALAVAAGLMAVLQPLDVRRPGFVLSFGATLALLEGARRGAALRPRHAALVWLVGSIVASSATEAALLPVSAYAFSRVTSAGLVLNLAAVPLMTVIQISGMIATALQALPPIAAPAGWTAHAAAVLLVESARLVEVAPWLARRVPPPHVAVMASYYAAAALVLWGRGLRRAAGAGWLLAALLALVGAIPEAAPSGDRLRVSVLDVGQAEAVLVQPPRGRALLVDAGGAPFGGATFDIGGRVVAPALWARGVRTLGVLAITHAHPDHAGGAAAVLRDFRPAALWEGVPVPGHEPSAALAAVARHRRVAVDARHAGETIRAGGAVVRVLHPPWPDWQRRDVRNDDSIVLEVVFRDVAFLLTGDVSAAVEEALVPRLTPAARRILKVAHHGSRTSTSARLLEVWRPDIAVISAGRGNTFGHPAPEVVRRLEDAGATVYRTDRDGQITIETDGRQLDVRTFVAGRDGR